MKENAILDVHSQRFKNEQPDQVCWSAIADLIADGWSPVSTPSCDVEHDSDCVPCKLRITVEFLGDSE